MANVFPNFPHGPEEEPAEAWTVEQALQYCLLQAHRETEEKYNQIETSLNQQLEKGKNDIWKCHKRVLEESTNEQSPNRSALRSVSSNKSGIKPKKTGSPTTVNIQITGGHYDGNAYTLVPKVRHPCWVGRSQGRKFKERGISLSKDLEISTTHGKFEVIAGKLHYTDTGSTNGSKVGEKELEPDAPLPLENGTELILGQSILKIQLS